ncbi:MAG: penicillin-binding protein 1C [bacterium]
MLRADWRTTLSRWWLRPASALVAIVFVVLIADRWLCPLPYDRLSRPAAHFVYSREGRLLSAFASSDGYWRRPETIEEISPRLITSVLACEDRWYRYHVGVNPFSLLQAAIDNLRAGRVVRGGSTITMQIARMMEPKERTVLSKLIEIGRALQLEWHFTKDELLEIYFDLAPYGGNIEGVGAASFFYFDKSPDELTWSEAAIPASPERYRPDEDPPACRQRRDAVLARLLRANVIDSLEYDGILAEEIPERRQKPPTVAPHFCQDLRSDLSGIIHSSIDFEVQLTCERLMTSHHGRLASLGIYNAALVVLDNATGEVMAMVGSPDFNDNAHDGQVNAARAARSPGSALKPFVYALALDRGLLSPEERVPDIPVNYRGYQPENYDELYHGMISVRQGLIRSYNVPAVNTLAEVGLVRFYRLLQSGGLSTLYRQPYDYGLPLVLGAAEVRLDELCNLYATLARQGLFLPLRQVVSGDNPKGRQILSPGSSYLISEILTDLKRPDLPDNWESTVDMPRVAWKTGTSYGRKDAWAIGFNRRYTVGVWAGNCRGEGSVDIVGAAIAAPLMLDVFDELTTGSDDWFEPPDEVAVRSVCAVSGRPVGRFCDETIEESFLIGVSPTATCPVHRPIVIDATTGYRLCRFCQDGHEKTRTVVCQWPSRVATWLSEHGGDGALPPHNPDCRGVIGGERPVIVSPDDGAVYELVGDVPPEFQKILLQASVAGGRSQVHWFVDGRHLGCSYSDDQVFYEPVEGRHTLTCLDESGRSETITFRVE